MWLLLLLACSTQPAPSAGRGTLAPPCPVGMLDIPGGRAWLGSWGPQAGVEPTDLPQVELELERFCIDPFPFPGQAGDHYPMDGMAFLWLEAWQELLASYGRRLCSAEELIWASASGPANLPYGAGGERSMLCEPHWDWERMSPYGSWPACVSPWGLYELNVFSSWGVATDVVDAVRAEPHPRPFLVVGGTNRDDTYYAATNFGLHQHGPDDAHYFDDQLRVCADPGVHADPSAWLVFRQAAANQGSFAAAMAWHQAYGPAASVHQAWTAPSFPDPDPWW
jgi:hypothetical protein